MFQPSPIAFGVLSGLQARNQPAGAGMIPLAAPAPAHSLAYMIPDVPWYHSFLVAAWKASLLGGCEWNGWPGFDLWDVAPQIRGGYLGNLSREADSLLANNSSRCCIYWQV